nr:T9SS type A sorting domain-containing protein [Bacteroidota bacterium]
MKKLASLSVLILLFHCFSISQPCLPEGITFTTQEEIDNFQLNHPGCTEIEGDVNIETINILNLNGLDVLTSIGGHLEFRLVILLSDFEGLNNLTEIGGGFLLSNSSLMNFTGLDNLEYIGGDLKIQENQVLSSLSGLENLVSIGGDLVIDDNDDLTDLSGFENLDGMTIMNLTITNNPILSQCDASFICDYLESPNGKVIIHSNALGFRNPVEIAAGCGITLPCLPYGDYFFYSQADIDAFPQNYPACIDLEGDVTIIGSTITNLNGLVALNSVGGSVNIQYNPLLTSLEGLDDLGTIGGNLRLTNNNALSSLEHLEDLTYIGGGFESINNIALSSIAGIGSLNYIGDFLKIERCYSLTNLDGLNNLTTIPGMLKIMKNDLLENINGLENISFVGGGLSIHEAEALSSLSPLANISEIGGGLSISNIDLLNDLSGLENVTTIGGGVSVWSNEMLSDITALQNLSSIHGHLVVYYCPGLTDLNGLNALQFIEGNLSIEGNQNMTGLYGLNNITYVGGSVWIRNNALMTLSDLSNLSSIGGVLEISENPNLSSLMGLHNVNSVGSSISIFRNSSLQDLNGMNGLTLVSGKLGIGKTMSGGNNALTSLAGLENVTKIEGDLRIFCNNNLPDLSGLDNLAEIEGNLIIGYREFGLGGNPSLTSLQGLNSLNWVGGDLSICDNPVQDLDALMNVDSIGGWLDIISNPSLTSLSGLDSIAEGTIEKLFIHNNSTLSDCAVESICEYLVAPNGTIEIHDNASGCSSFQQVEDACETLSIDENQSYLDLISISPNPFTRQTTIEFTLHEPGFVSLVIHDETGKRVQTLHSGNLKAGAHHFTWDAGTKQPGIYLLKMETTDSIRTEKLLLME